MPIQVICPNGHKLTAQDNLAGKQVKCPKCASVIRIPAAEVPLVPAQEMSDFANLDFDNPGDNSALDPFGQPANHVGSSDPFAVDPFASDPFSQPATNAHASHPVAQPYAAQQGSPRSASTPNVSVKSGSRASGNDNLAILIGIATAGAICGLSFVGLIGWFLLGSSKNEISQAPAPSLPAATSPATPAATSPAQPDQASARPTQTQPAEAPAPSASEEKKPGTTDLRRIELDERLLGFDLPASTWSSAYDEKNGHLAVTHDEKGVLIYDVDDLVQGNTAVKSIFATDGVPSAVCLKQFEDKRVFVIAGKDSPDLQLIDADSLQPLTKIHLANVAYVDFLTGSTNPKDPYVYFSTANESSNPREVAGLMGRVDLVTGKQGEFSKSPYMDAALSQDGSTIYARMKTYGGAKTRMGRWDDFVSLPEDQLMDQNGGLDYGESVPYVFNNCVAISQRLYTKSLGIGFVLLDHLLGAEFRSQPILFGIGKAGVCFSSANNGRRLDVAPLPSHWFPDASSSQRTESRDFRARNGVSTVVNSDYYNIFADDQRQLGVAILAEQVVVAPIKKFNIPNEPNLQPTNVLPTSVVAGEQIELQLATADPNTVFEYIPNTDWLLDERTRLVGSLPPGEASPDSLLRLQQSIGSDDNRVKLVDVRQLGNRKPPFKLRIRNEIMEVTGIEKDWTLIVTRTQNLLYARDERVAVVDDSGTELDPKGAELVTVPEGKRIVLSASINGSQKRIIVNSMKPFEGERFPCTIQVNDEQMTVLGVDRSTEQLNVERTNPVPHEVTSVAFVIGNPARPSGATRRLPIVEGNKLRWTPSYDQIGRQNIRLRAKSGSATHEWFWETEVKSGTTSFPFELAGIEVEKGGSLAVVWGQSKLPILPLKMSPTNLPAPQGVEYFVGVYDVATKELLRHSKISKPITCATIHNGQIVACVNQAKTQLIRLDPQTFKEVVRIDIPSPCLRLQAIGGKFLVGKLASGQQDLRLTFPELKPLEPTQIPYPYPLAGRLQDGWVWDGVVWNESMTKPRLLLYPVHFESSIPNSHSGAGFLHNKEGFSHTYTQGFVSAWFPITAVTNTDCSLYSHSYPAGFDCEALRLKATSWADSSLQTVDGSQSTKTLTVISPSEITKILIKKSMPADFGAMPLDLRASLTSAYMSEDEQHVHIASLGELFSVKKDQMFDVKDFFRFEAKQDTFILNAEKSNKIRYSAPGATNYQFQLWFAPQGHFDDPPKISLESTNGEFEIDFDPQIIANLAIGLLGGNQPITKDALAAYSKKITPAYKLLTGKAPRTVCVPVYVLVLADRPDGQKACLVHSYLVEVPPKMLQAKMQQRQ